MPRTDQQQLKHSQVSSSLTWTPDCGLQKCLTELSEDPAVVQNSDTDRKKQQQTNTSVSDDDLRVNRSYKCFFLANSLVQIFSRNRHVIRRLQR